MYLQRGGFVVTELRAGFPWPIFMTKASILHCITEVNFYYISASILAAYQGISVFKRAIWFSVVLVIIIQRSKMHCAQKHIFIMF